MASFRDVVAWQKAMELLTKIYLVTESFPQREMYGLTQQIRRAALSVPSNIAEGKGRQTKKDYLQFLYRARGSLFEVVTQLDASKNLKFLDDPDHAQSCELAAETGRVLNGLIANVKKQIESDEAHPRSPNS
jgi:four helix bundle protein